jgi:hypothetical protein
LKRFAVFAVALFALGACAAPVTEGTVIGREYDDPDTWSSSEPVYTQQCRQIPVQRTRYTNNKPSYYTEYQQRCENVVSYWHPVQHYDGPHWRLKLDDGERTGWVTVSESEYGRYTIGEHYPEASNG